KYSHYIEYVSYKRELTYKKSCVITMDFYALLEAVDHYSSGVRHLLFGKQYQFFPDHLRSNGSLLLVADLIRRIKQRTFRQMFENLCDEIFDVLSGQRRDRDDFFEISCLRIPVDHRKQIPFFDQVDFIYQ